jgi:diacylglycerol kinase family enzyme
MRILVVINNRSGGGDAALYAFIRALGASGAEVTLRYADQDTTLEALTHDAVQFDRVVAAGGDGTAGAVSYALRNTGVPLLIYPAGTANLLALNLGMPFEPRTLAETVLNGVALDFDLGEIEQPSIGGAPSRKQGFAVVAGAGYDAAIMESAQALKPALGAAAYLLAAVTNMTPTNAKFELELDGKRVSTEGIAVLLVNFGKLQFDMPVARGADPRDGLFDIAVVRSRNVAGLLPAVMSNLLDPRTDIPTPGIDLFTASHVTLSAYPPLRMQYDGEVADALTPFSAQMLPKAVRLLLPQDSPYLRG